MQAARSRGTKFGLRCGVPTRDGNLADSTNAFSSRIYGHSHPRSINGYIAQQVLSVLTPAFFAAAHFTCLGLTILTFGKKYAVISPRYIVPFFVSIDLVSLILQGTGSGMAAIAEQQDPPESTIPGAWIVVAGLFVQLLAYVFFNIVFIIFALRTRRDPPQHPLWTPRMRLFLFMVWISSLLVLMRSSYRVGELASGWIGFIATTEWYFYVFDAAPVTLAVLILLPFHPGFFLPTGIRLMKRENNVPAIEEQIAEKQGHKWSSYQGARQEVASETSSQEERTHNQSSADTSETTSQA